MAIEPGGTLSHYRLVEKIGEGGMGVVWKGIDTTLDREVAIKLLPEAFAADPDRLTRFGREARLLASLNHPGIATIHGLHQAEGVHFLAMELVDGVDLAQRLARGPLPLDEALRIGLELTEALEAAHASGVVHRDLKPANVKLTSAGKVKVLDFGLAKALSAGDPEKDMSMSPTMTAAATQAGMIMGTAAYMSPEQARGKPVDRRADIWAFGCVLYEMLTGRKPFEGEDATEVMAHIITREPDLGCLPAELPEPVRDLIRRCLRKDAGMRLPDIGAARIAILESEDASTPVETGRSSSFLRLATLGVVALVAGVLLGWIFRGGASSTTGEASATHFDLVLEPPIEDWWLAISPDGGNVIYSGHAEGKKLLYLRNLSGFASQPIPGTEGGRWPFFSPDGRKIGFFAAGRLKIVTLQGGLAEPVCAVPGVVTGVFWTQDDQIIYSTDALSVPYRVSASGGEPRALELAEMEAGARLTFPAALPGHSALLATLQAPSLDGPRIVVVDFADGKMKIVARGHSARYVAPGRLLFLQRDRPMVAPFDVPTRDVTGAEHPADLDAPAIGAQFYASIAENGTLLYISGELDNSSELHWLARDGTVEPIGITGTFPQLDSTGRHALTLHDDPGDTWLVDLDEGETTRLTFSGQTMYPRWSRDDRNALFGYQNVDGYSIYTLPVGGGGEPRLLLDESDELPSIVPTSTHPDGRTMIYSVHPETSRDIWMLDEKGDRQPVLQTSANERAGALSPDGDLFAYVSDEDGLDRLFIRELPDTGRRWPVTSDEGMSPVWSRDGSELFFRVGDAILVAPIQRDGHLRVGEAVEIFRSKRLYRDDWGNTTFDSAPDGRLLISLHEPEDVRPRIVLNWNPGTSSSHR